MVSAAYVLRLALRERLWPTTGEYDIDAYNEDEITGDLLPIAVLVNKENNDRISVAQELVYSMNRIGFYTELLILPFEEYSERLHNRDFDIFVGGFLLSLIPDVRFAFHSQSPQNLFSFSCEETDRLMEIAVQTGNDALFMIALADIKKQLSEELPVVSLAFRHSAIVVDRRIHGELSPNAMNIFANVHQWFILAQD